MNKNEVKGYAVRASESSATFLASTDQLARDGMIIERTAWKLDNFRRNPVILWSHMYNEPPIGRARDVRVTDAGLVVDVEWDMEDPKSASLARKVKNGFLGSTSVGFDILDRTGHRVTSAELLEVSLVAIPADPGVMALARAAYRKAGPSGDWWSQPFTGTYTKSKRRFTPNELILIDSLVSVPRGMRDTVLRGLSDAQLRTVAQLLKDFDRAGDDGVFQLKMSRAIRGVIRDFQKGVRV